MSVLSEVTTYLAAQGIGVAGTNLFYGPMHEEYPDAVTVVNVYGGIKPEPNLGDTGTFGDGRAARLVHPRLQILCRGASNDTIGPLTKCTNVRDAVLKVLNTTLSGTYYLSIDPLQDPTQMPSDKNFRESYVLNVECNKEPS